MIAPATPKPPTWTANRLELSDPAIQILAALLLAGSDPAPSKPAAPQPKPRRKSRQPRMVERHF